MWFWKKERKTITAFFMTEHIKLFLEKVEKKDHVTVWNVRLNRLPPCFAGNKDIALDIFMAMAKMYAEKILYSGKLREYDIPDEWLEDKSCS